MTRITNFGRKRTHVEASFNYNQAELGDTDAESPQCGAGDKPDAITNEEDAGTAREGCGVDGEPPKKRRKRGPRKKVDAKAVTVTADKDGDEVDEEGAGRHSNEAVGREKKKEEPRTRSSKGPSPQPSHACHSSSEFPPARKEASENRRRRRMTERHANTTCFACREKGHAVQDCPKIADGSIKPPEKKSGFSATGVVGICYRCGSRKHRLSACREKVSDPSNPLPFASCFVCNGNGHLASQCPENKEKGVYPNGGSCKLCGETDHLARDCKLRDKGAIDMPGFTVRESS